MKILFLHGFASSGMSGTARILRQMYPDAEVIAPDIPLDPREALPFLKELAASSSPDVILGTSMGGMYAEQLYGFDRILVNPAFELADTILKNNGLGRRQFHNPRQDGAKDFLVTKGMLEAFREVSSHCFEGASGDELKRVYALFGRQDTLVDTKDLTRAHYPQCIGYEGEHSLNETALMRAVKPVITWITDAQAGRSKPSIFICFDDVLRFVHNGEEVAAGPRAVLSLMDSYDLRFILEQEPDRLMDASSKLEWLERHIGVPAWDRCFITSDVSSLFGDYLIDAHPDRFHADAFMGTVLHFASDSFKDWDEVLTFFNRLGGQ